MSKDLWPSGMHFFTQLLNGRGELLRKELNGLDDKGDFLPSGTQRLYTTASGTDFRYSYCTWTRITSHSILSRYDPHAIKTSPSVQWALVLCTSYTHACRCSSSRQTFHLIFFEQGFLATCRKLQPKIPTYSYSSISRGQNILS